MRRTPTMSVKSLALRVALAATLTAGACFGWPAAARWQRVRVAERLADRAAAAEGGDCRALVERLAAMGAPAIEPLVRLATAEQPAASSAARDAVLSQLAEWEIEFASRGDAEQLTGRLHALAIALDGHAGDLDAEGWVWAQRLSRQIVDHSRHASAMQAASLLAACGRIVALNRPPAAPDQRLASLPPPPIVPAAPPAPPMANEMNPAPAPAEPALPPREAPVEPDAARPLADLRVALPPLDGRRKQVPPKGLLVIEPQREMAEPVDGSARPLPLAPVVEPADAIVDVPSPAEVRRAVQRQREYNDRELVSRLEAAPRFEAAAIRHVLRQRGYSDDLLKAMRQLEQQSVAERRQSLDRIGSLPAADSRRLLRWFVADADAEVRLHALTLLATAGDPLLSEILQQRAAEDADPRVAELATRLMRE